MKQIILTLTAILILCGCETKKTAEQIFDEAAPGVALVLNKYYYEISLPDGEKLYCTGFDTDEGLQGLTPDKEEALKNRGSLTGTAFFIGDDGRLLTNRHVVAPIIDKMQVKHAILDIMRTIRNMYTYQMGQLSSQYDMLEAEKNNCYTVDDYGNVMQDQARLYEITSRQEELRQQYNQMSQTANEIADSIDPEGISIKPVCEIGIAYNNTFVTGEADFLEKNPCVVVKESEKKDVDLAVIQLKDKKTPPQAFVFSTGSGKDGTSLLSKVKNLFGEEKPQHPQIDQQLYMIGYNAGIALANTRQGIKAQMTSGKITQMPDGQRLLYSIPALPGSSGSPVIDEEGRLVAVNFAKLGNTDNFNFGIPLERIREFVGDE